MSDAGSLLLVGIVGGDAPTELNLARAATSAAGLSTRSVAPDTAPDPTLSALVVDVDLDDRADILRRLAATWQVPILVEAPAADTPQQLRYLAEATGDRIVSANPLRYGLHTRRLIEEYRSAEDPLETVSATLRFRRPSLPGYALSRLLDYLNDLYPEDIERIAAMAYQDPLVQVVSLRYASGALGSLEVGAHLPANFPNESELIVECLCRSHLFRCAPAHQSVSVYDPSSVRRIDWQPDPADAIVKSFTTWLRDGPRPAGDVGRDLAAISLARAIADAAGSDQVARSTGP